LLARHDGRDRLGTRAQEIASLAQDLSAIIGGDFSPDLEAAVRGRKRAVEISRFGLRQAADGLASRWIEHRQRDAAPPLHQAPSMKSRTSPSAAHLECSSNQAETKPIASRQSRRSPGGRQFRGPQSGRTGRVDRLPAFGLWLVH
jgi:hypothetical protein